VHRLRSLIVAGRSLCKTRRSRVHGLRNLMVAGRSLCKTRRSRVHGLRNLMVAGRNLGIERSRGLRLEPAVVSLQRRWWPQRWWRPQGRP
jgi:hypothetical protein